ncbi:CHY_zinc finger domain-containing protein [Hexamita inflata]|uniref:CHY_zinc finger domain-containing protein n=1 Tax=Hexamita inflata TaxID=28002 RepID=A0ABP1HP41_9EUKA
MIKAVRATLTHCGKNIYSEFLYPFNNQTKFILTAKQMWLLPEVGLLFPLKYFQENTSFNDLVNNFNDKIRNYQVHHNWKKYINLDKAVHLTYDISEVFGCDHTLSNYNVYCQSCEKWYACAACHDCDHDMVVSKYRCLNCEFNSESFTSNCPECKINWKKQVFTSDLSCGICQGQIFDMSISLHCGHAFHSLCVERLYIQDELLNCPICREQQLKPVDLIRNQVKLCAQLVKPDTKSAQFKCKHCEFIFTQHVFENLSNVCPKCDYLAAQYNDESQIPCYGRFAPIISEQAVLDHFVSKYSSELTLYQIKCKELFQTTPELVDLLIYKCVLRSFEGELDVRPLRIAQCLKMDKNFEEIDKIVAVCKNDL